MAKGIELSVRQCRFDHDLVSHPHTPLNPVKLDRKRCFMRIERMKVDGILTGTPTGEKNPCLKRCVKPDPDSSDS